MSIHTKVVFFWRPPGWPAAFWGDWRLLAQGHLYKEIADQLGLSIETVRTHIRNIYDRLHVRSRTEAVNKVYGAGARPVS